MKKLITVLGMPFKWFWYASKKKKALVVVALVAGLVAYNKYNENVHKRDGYNFDTAVVGDVVEVVSESGTVVTGGRTDVYSPATGIVEEVWVQNGDMVSIGQELYMVRSTATEQQKQAAYASYLSAQSSLNASQATATLLRSSMYTQWETFRNLATNDRYETSDGVAKNDERLDTKFQTSQDDWVAAEKKYKDQQTAIAAAQASVSSAYYLYQATQDATVTARADGTIANLSVARGDRVTAYDSAAAAFGTSTSPVLRIANYETTGVKVGLGQTEIAKVHVGQNVTFHPDAYKDKTYQGRVIRVDDIGEDTSGVVRYIVYMAITDADDLLKPGMTLDADIETNRLSGVLTVPNAAVKPYEGAKAVRVLDDTGQIQYMPVAIGIKGEKYTQILSGISQGQEVIVSVKNEKAGGSRGLFGR